MNTCPQCERKMMAGQAPTHDGLCRICTNFNPDGSPREHTSDARTRSTAWKSNA